jgi:hypothetical protein
LAAEPPRDGPPEVESSPPLTPNGKPSTTTVSDLVAVQNYLASQLDRLEGRLVKRIEEYIEDHRQVHREHLLDVKPYIDYVDRERQKDEDWDARLRPAARTVRFLARNWRSIAPFLIALLIATGILRGDFHVELP